jgi:hypothetical protein
MNMEIRRFTPFADKRVLVFLAGSMWCGVGIMLVNFGMKWASITSGNEKIVLYTTGFLAAMGIHHFGFLKVADKNLRRLLPLSQKRCVFSFMTWKSYILVAFMMTLGITLRHSSIPKPYLSVLYNGIGLALFLSGIRYFRFFVKLILSKDSESNITSDISSQI